MFSDKNIRFPKENSQAKPSQGAGSGRRKGHSRRPLKPWEKKGHSRRPLESLGRRAIPDARWNHWEKKPGHPIPDARKIAGVGNITSPVRAQADFSLILLKHWIPDAHDTI